MGGTGSRSSWMVACLRSATMVGSRGGVEDDGLLQGCDQGGNVFRVGVEDGGVL
jgi:hypothetical protein